MRIIFHIDVNSAFLSWTAVDLLSKDATSTDIRTIPAIIGGNQKTRHGIVLAKSVPAKAFNIQTGEPVHNALLKCANLSVYSPDINLYRKNSHELMELLRTFSPIIEQVSIDECFMDFTNYVSKYASPVDAANIIRNKVRDTFGFTVNIGISNVKILAKMASDFKKPDLCHTLFESEIQEKMWPLPIEDLLMCGKSSVATLKKLGIHTIGQLALTDPALLTPHLKSHGRMLWEYANGIDNSPVEPIDSQAKGVGNSTTLESDVLNIDDAKPVLLKLSESVASRLRKNNFRAHTITVEIKYSDFTSCSRQITLPQASDSTESIYQHSLSLYQELWNGSPVRLIGVRTTKLTTETEPVQLSLFDMDITNTSVQSSLPQNNIQKQANLDKALDNIRNKYGKGAIVRGTFYKKDIDH